MTYKPPAEKRRKLRRRIHMERGSPVDLEDREAFRGLSQTKYLSEDHVAVTLKVGILVVRAMCERGQIPGAHIFAGRWVFDATEFWDWMVETNKAEDYRPPVEEPLVYFIQHNEDDPNSPIKIGVSTTLSILNRVSELQVGNPFRLKVLATMIGTVKDEARLHETFAHARLRGEWFKPCEALLIFIAGLRA